VAHVKDVYALETNGPFSSALQQFCIASLEPTLGFTPLLGRLANNWCIVHVGFGAVGAIQVIACPGGLDGDGDVDLFDLAASLAVYGTSCS